MAKYTIELRKIIDLYGRSEVESWFTDYNLADYLTPTQIQTITDTGVWTKEKLARKIINHYYMREIGLETPALFKHYVKVKLDEIMESKLPLIYTNAIQYDPLINVDFTEEFTRNIGQQQNTTGTSSDNATASGLTVNSNTPQGKISKEGILEGDYATTTSAYENETESNVTTNSDGTSNTDETYTKRVRGNQGISASYQAMIKQFRENIVSIDKDIIEELNVLFIGLF